MNKLITKIATACVGLAMAVGVGVAIGNNGAESVSASTQTLTFSLTSNPGGWPTTNSTTETSYTYTLDDVDYSFTTKNVKCNSGYLMLTQPAALGLPAISGSKLTKVVAHNSSGCSTSTKVGISTSASDADYVSGGALQTWSTTSSSYTYELTGTAVNTRYYIYVTNKNAQLYSLDLTYETSSVTPTGPFTVSFNTHGGSAVASQSVAKDGYATQPADPTRSGFTFGGWYTSNAYTNLFDFANTPITADITIHAKWILDLDHAGTEQDPYSISDARKAIDANEGITNVYVSGVISQVDSYDSTHNSITYWISDDGTTTNQLEVYSGKGLNGANFSAKSDVMVGANVVVYGTLKKYNSTYEFDMNSQLASYTEPVVETKYDVTFNANGGTNPGAMEVGEGLTFYFPSAGTVSNKLFKGWSSDGGSTFFQEGDTSPAVNADITYTAYWQSEGTSATPYTVAQARTAIDAGAGIRDAHVSATISQVDSYNSGTITYWISDDGTTTNQLEVYKGKSLNNESFTSKDDVEVGATVTVFGNLKKYNTTYEFDSGNYQKAYTAPAAVTVESIEISGSLTKSSYTTAEQWSPAGLTVTANYSDSSSGDVTSSVSWSYSPATPSAMGAGTSSLTITATYEGQTDSTSKSVTVTTVSFDNSTNLTPGNYYIAYNDFGTKHYISSVANGKGATNTNKENGIVFTFTLVGNDSWEITNSTNYLGVGTSSTSLTLDSTQTTLSIAWENETNGTRKISGSSGRDLAWYASNNDIRTYSGKTDGTNGMTLVDPNEVETTYTITYNANGGSGDTMSNTVGAAPQVASCSYSAPNGKVFSRWNTESDGSGDDYKPGDIAESNLDLYAIWVTEIGHNVVMAGLSNASEVTINGNDGYKCGTGSKQGEMTITLKVAGITKIKAYVAAWNADTTNNTVSVSISNGTISPTSLTLTNDSGLNGNGSAFTLGGNEIDYRFDFTIQNAPADAIITLSADNAANNRFVVWGATDQFAETFASEFLGNLSCTSAGTSQPTFNTGYDWLEFEGLFYNLDAEEQAKLHDAEYTVSGTGADTVVTAKSGTAQSVAEAVAKYDYIVGKYLKGQGLSAYKDFMNRNPAAIGSSSIRFGLITDSSEVTTMIVIISLISLTAVGGFFFIRKKKLVK